MLDREICSLKIRVSVDFTVRPNSVLKINPHRTEALVSSVRADCPWPPHRHFRVAIFPNGLIESDVATL
jgi:hypothetical protein